MMLTRPIRGSTYYCGQGTGPDALAMQFASDNFGVPEAHVAWMPGTVQCTPSIAHPKGGWAWGHAGQPHPHPTAWRTW